METANEVDDKGMSVKDGRILNWAFGLGALLCLAWKTIGVVKVVGERSYNSGIMFTTWLVDYSQGYVRRGLCGQIVRFLRETLGVEPQWTILVCSVALYGVLVVLCFAVFRRRGWCWWPIMLTVCLGGLSALNRDALVLLTCMVCYWVAGRVRGVFARYLLLNVLVVTLVNVHEIGFFLVFPFLSILCIGDVDAKLPVFMRPTLLLPSCMAFFLVATFRGNEDMASKMVAGWRPILPAWWDGVTGFRGVHSDIGSTGGSLLAKMVEIWGGEWHGVPNAAYMLFAVVAFYAIVSTLPFKMQHTREKSIARVLLLVQMAALSVVFPFFYDYARLFGFCAMSTLTCVALVPSEKWLVVARELSRALGGVWHYAEAAWVKVAARKWLPARFVAICALLVGVQPIYFDIPTSAMYSYVGMLCRAIRMVLGLG